MIKAVVFKEEKHGHLMTWLKEFKDSSGKKNDSEAIRTLMQLGYEYLQLKNDESVRNIPTEKIDKEILKEQIQKSLQNSLEESLEDSIKISLQNTQESLKKELMNEVMLEINNKINNQMLNGINTIVDKLSDIQIQQSNIQPIQPAINTAQIQSAIQETVSKVLSESKQLNHQNSSNIQDVIPSNIPSKPIKKNIPKIEGNALLANLLGNADR